MIFLQPCPKTHLLNYFQLFSILALACFFFLFTLPITLTVLHSVGIVFYRFSVVNTLCLVCGALSQRDYDMENQ